MIKALKENLTDGSVADSGFTFHYVDFYVLKPGDKFRHEKVIWQKIDDDTARSSKNEIRHFWPLHSARLLKPISEAEITEIYPILAYSL